MNIIKYTCHKCNKFFSKTEQQTIDEKKSHRLCECGGKLHIEVIDLTTLLEEEIKKTVSLYVSNWFKTEGIEWTIELIERCTMPKIKEYYMDELKRRGLK